jgi:hypothetical protein
MQARRPLERLIAGAPIGVKISPQGCRGRRECHLAFFLRALAPIAGPASPVAILPIRFVSAALVELAIQPLPLATGSAATALPAANDAQGLASVAPTGSKVGGP